MFGSKYTQIQEFDTVHNNKLIMNILKLTER